MRYHHLLFLGLFLLTGCDEFLLKKTATIRAVTGSLRYVPDGPQLVMDLTYDMVNNQDYSLREVYFYCHEGVSIDAVYDQNTPLRLEQGVGIGMSIKVYRVRVSEWLPLTRRLLRIFAKINGSVETSGFFLNEKGVFLESSKVWIPVSFNDSPSFRYTITLITPEGYDGILGGKLLKTSTTNQMISSQWQSESTNLLLTGNLIIGHFSRLSASSLTLYLPDTIPELPEKRASALLDILTSGKDILTRQLGEYPFSETRVVFLPRTMTSLEPWTDGLFLGNIILLDENLASTLTNMRKTPLDEVLLSDQNWLTTIKIIIHELAHGYLGYTLRWEQDDTLPIESLTEVVALKTLEWLTPETYQLAINTLSFNWQQNRLSPPSFYTTFLYRTLLMSSLFQPREYFRLLRGLRNRYLYSTIDEKTIIQTLRDLGETNNQTILLSSWDDLPSWEMKLAFVSNTWIVSHSFPCSLPITLSIHNKNTITNITKEISNEISLRLPWRSFSSASLHSPFQWLDTSSGDDIISPELTQLLSLIQDYYNGNPSPALQVSSSRLPLWRTPEEDRFLSLVAFPSLSLVLHRQEVKKDAQYLFVYKHAKNQPKSYAILILRQTNGQWIWEGVYDPFLPYLTHQP